MILKKRFFNIISKLLIKDTKFIDDASPETLYYVSRGLCKNIKGDSYSFRAFSILKNKTVDVYGYDCSIKTLLVFIKRFKIELL